ncbi:sensor histidine kinase [Olivibacter sp. XZL3]|uniref:sensor histidine kinase n=1 Tax=Olivibacter sp. XZL3 TaxID=1735116 RepID=UPI001065E7BE|nr:sensor histidine kinase [Olivibacter sp. XZL3]
MGKTFLNFLLKYRAHIITWTIFMLYETMIVGIVSGKFGKPPSYIVHYAIYIGLFYFHAHYVLPRILKRGIAFLTLPAGIVLEVIAYYLFYYVIANFASYYPHFFGIERINFERANLIKVTWRTLYFIGFSTGYYFLINLLKEKERTASLERRQLHQIIAQQKMEKELANAQNAYLRAQINPHFLFNTLNFIYNKTRKSAPIAADAILTLSAMMRYAVESSEDKGYIAIEEEIEQVHNLIHLHRLRQNHQIYFNIEVEEKVRSIWMIPLVLITLTENIFKHGNLSLSNHPATLRLYTDEDSVFIETKNLINAIHNTTGLSKGLENIAKRLEHTYGDQATFTYFRDGKNYFQTKVQIKLSVLNGFVGSLAVSDKIGK